MSQLISVGFGKVSFARSNSSLSTMVIYAPFSREFPSKRFSRQGTLQRFQATDNPEINGSLFVDSLSDVPDGTILLLQTSVKRGAIPVRDGAIFLSTRASGPLISVSTNLYPAAESRLGDKFLSFSGRADRVSLEDLKDLGIRPYASFVRTYMDEEEVEECFYYEVLSKEKEAKTETVVVEKADGTKTTIPGRRKRVISRREMS